MFVRDWMTPEPVTVEGDAPIGKAREMLAIHRIRRLPVVLGGVLAGIVTDRDLRAAAVSAVNPAAGDAERAAADQAPVRALCAKAPVTVKPDDTLEYAAALMARERISGLPVVEGETVAGIITETDVFRALVDILGFHDHEARLVLNVGPADPPLWQQLQELAERGLAPTSVVTYHRRAGGDPRAVVRTARPSAGGGAQE